MRKILRRKFFDRDTVLVAEEILGKFLVRKIGRREISLMITEVEVYDGFKDRASHASRGKTARNSIMFGEAGRWYVYFTYGMHWMLNVVTREKGYPAAILIRGLMSADLRGLKNTRGQTRIVLDGPAKLTRFLKIDKRLNGLLANKKSGLWVEARPHTKRRLATQSRFFQNLRYGVGVEGLKVSRGPRVGVDFAGLHWARRKWRFWIGG